jgi:hypothetical protein
MNVSGARRKVNMTSTESPFAKPVAPYRIYLSARAITVFALGLARPKSATIGSDH